jgi:hypothetical protein
MKPAVKPTTSQAMIPIFVLPCEGTLRTSSKSHQHR